MSRRFLTILLVSLLAACADRGIVVQTDFDAQARIGRDRSYNWIATPDGIPAPTAQAIVDGIDARLQAAGWKPAAHGEIEVSAHVTTRDGQTYNNFYSGIGHSLNWLGIGPGNIPSSVTMSVDHYQAGTLVVDMFDAGTRRAIWRGNAGGMLPDDPARRDAAIQRAIDRMFANFPPPAGTAPH